MFDKERKKSGQCIHYKIAQLKLKVIFDILNYISENVTLVQLMDTVVYVNNAVGIVVYCIFYSNFKSHFR